MSFNKKILALAIAGILPGAAFAFVDMNNPTTLPSVVPIFASEVAVPVGGLDISNAPGELNIRVAAGFGVSVGQTRFIRFDYPGLKLKNPVIGGDFNVLGAGAGTFTVVDGGDTTKEYVIVQVTATAGILPTDQFTFNPSTLPIPPGTGGAVKVFNQNPQTIKYALYEFGGNAVGQTSPLSGPLSTNWFTWASGVTAACAAPALPFKINASNPKVFVGGIAPFLTSALYDITLQPTPGILLPSTGAGPLGGLSDFMGVGTTVKTTGSFVGALTLNALPGASVSTDGLTFSTSTFTPGAPGAFVSFHVIATTTGAVPMVASGYSVLITPTSGALATLNPINLGVCGRLEFSGSSDRVDYGLTPGSTNKQYLRITNPTKDSGAVNVTVWNDAGLAVTFPLSTIKVGSAPGVNLPGILSAFSSTPIIDVNAFDTAAKSVNAAFSVGTGIDGKPGKIRIEVRGDFGDNLVDGNGNETAPVLKKGIYLQAINNGSFHQSH